MKKIYLLFSFGLLGTFANSVFAQPASVVLIPTVGANVVFPSITSAYAAIPASPSSSYTIEILATYNGTDASEVYPIQLTDKGITPGGAVSITIRPALGNNGESIQRATADPAPTIQFNGADNVILDGRPGGVTSSAANYLTVSNLFTSAVAVSTTFRDIELLNSANSNTIQYINATMAAATSAAGCQGIVVGSTTTTGNNSNKILNNVVSGGARGIQDFGLSAAVPNSATAIQGNTVRDYSGIGIFAGTQQNVTVASNILQVTGTALLGTSLEGIRNQATAGTSFIVNNTINIATTSTTITSVTGFVDLAAVGIENISGNSIVALSAPSATSVIGLSLSAATVNPGNTFNISQNRMSGLTSNGLAANIRGMSLFPNNGGTLNVTNNFISITDPNTTATAIFGILFGATTGASYTSNVYYNSLRIAGTHTTGTTATISGSGIYRSDNSIGSVFNLKNNIALMERSSTAPPLMVGFFNSSANGTLAIDYNDWFAPATSTNAFAAGWVTTLYNDIVTYKAAATPNEQNTTFTTVNFVSNTDLHLTGASTTEPTLKGTPIAGTTIDIDGNLRSAVTPTKGADEPGGAVPVELFAFAGSAKATFNHLSWSTASENNNSGFDLQRSADGREFSTIGFVPTKATNGNSSVTLNYGFDDVQLLSSEVSYYRLKQIDKDGLFKYSATVKVIRTNNSYEITLVNPSKGNVQIRIRNEKDANASIQLITLGGQILAAKNVNFLAGTSNLTIGENLNLAKGMYIIRIVVGKDVTTRQVIIE